MRPSGNIPPRINAPWESEKVSTGLEFSDRSIEDRARIRKNEAEGHHWCDTSDLRPAP